LVAPPRCEAQARADAPAELSGVASVHEARAIGASVSSGLLLAGGLFAGIFGAYELAQPDHQCVEHNASGTCIQVQSPNAEDRMLSGLLLGAGILELAFGVVNALIADNYFQQLAHVRRPSASSLELAPWASFDGRGGAGGVVLRW